MRAFAAASVSPPDAGNFLLSASFGVYSELRRTSLRATASSQST